MVVPLLTFCASRANSAAPVMVIMLPFIDEKLVATVPSQMFASKRCRSNVNQSSATREVAFNVMFSVINRLLENYVSTLQ